jgi:hypothetical protein
LLNVDAWLHPNVPGRRDVGTGRSPFCLELDEGIAVYPPAMTAAPRLPLLGLRAPRLAGLHLNIDCSKLTVNIQRPHRFWMSG